MKNVMAKGSLWIMFSQGMFMVSSYLVHILLGRSFGPELYGVFGIILSLMVLVQIFLQKGLPQAVSKFMAEYPDKQEAIFKEAVKLQWYLSIFFTIIYFLLADFISYFLKDPSLTGYIRLSSLLIIPMAFFTLYTLGFLNGKRSFKKQAFASIVNSLAKLIFTFLVVYLGYKIYGVIIAYILTPIISVLIAKSLIKIKKSSVIFSKKKLIYFAVPVIIFALAYRLLRYVDLLLIKRITLDNTLTGLYTSAMTISEISLFLFAAVSFTLLPSISKAIAENDKVSLKSYINKSLRYALMLMIPFAFLISATSTNLISLLYSEKFAAAAPALEILVFGATFLSIFSILSSIIMGSGKPKQAMYMGIVLIPVSITLNYLLIPILEIRGAAIAMTMTTLLGVIITAIYIFQKFKTLVSLKSILRILFASTLIYFLALNYQLSGLWLLIVYTILMLIYFLILLALKEINQEDIKLVKSILRR